MDELEGELGEGVEQLCNLAYGRKLVGLTDLHGYHCDCHQCSHERERPLMAVQEDGSVGVEFVSRICDATDDDTIEEIAEWVDMMKGWRGWMPDGYTNCGNHIHISASGDAHRQFTNDQKDRAYRHIDALYAVFDWRHVADGGCGRIRDYNCKPGRGGGGSWLSRSDGYGTFEHRLWNTPRTPERLWAHIGISLALTRWGFALTDFTDDELWTIGHPNGWSAVSMSDEQFARLNDARPRLIEVLRAYIPHQPEFDIARDVIGNLAST
jgi:hypothetical protein